MCEHNPVPINDDLALTALRFAAGELSQDRANEFAERMAHDQAARDALSDAIRLSAAALGQSSPTPDPLVRESVREQVRGTWLGWLFPRRPYRGHPVAWAGLGGTIAASLTVFGVWLGDQPDSDEMRPLPATPMVRLPSNGDATDGTHSAIASQPDSGGKPSDTVAIEPLDSSPTEPMTVEPPAVVTTTEPVDRGTVNSNADEKIRGSAYEKPARPGDVRAGDGVNAATSVP